MIAHIARFEVRYHLARVSTYVYFGVWFAISFLSMTLSQGGSRQYVDNPSALASQMAGLTAFGVVVISAICGMAVCRDFELNVYPLLFTRPIRRRDYLAGRWLGSLVVCALVFAALPLGLLAGTWMPWVDRTYRMPFAIWPYVQPYLLFTGTAVFAFGTLFFALGALTRRVTVVYLQGALLLSIYLFANGFFPGSLDDYWLAFFDPFGLTTIRQATKYWTIVETNSQVVPLAGVVLANRLLWCGAGVLAALAVFRFFPFSAEVFASRRRRLSETPAAEAATAIHRAPAALPAFGRRATRGQFLSLTRLRLRTIVTDLVFLALVVVALALQVGDAWGQPMVTGTPVYPVTYLMTDGVGMLLAIVITAIYAGELVWRDRQVGFAQVHDALPAPGWLDFGTQFAALALLQAALLAADMLTGIVSQASLGYHRFELGLYVTEIFVLRFSVLLLYAVLALFVQTASPSKFLGHAVVVAVFLAPTAILEPLANRVDVTFPLLLYAYAGVPAYTYSDMNGYGPFVRPLAWFTFYWVMWAGILAVGTVLLARRGSDTGWLLRLRQARGRVRMSVVAVAALLFACALGSGGWIYYNVRVLAEFVPPSVDNARRARYEKDYRQYETLPQPKVTAVDVRVEIYPKRRAATAAGMLTLQNKTTTSIQAIHVAGDDWLREVSFDRPATAVVADDDVDYAIYELSRPLEPGEVITLRFATERENPGFRDADEPTSIVANGTFFNSTFMPAIGYQRDRELTDEGERKRQGLGERADLPDPGAPDVRMSQHFSSDADWVSYHAVIGTEPDQIAVTPGYLVREWTENGRRYFEYDFGDTPGLKFFSYLSGRYEVKRESWNGISIEVYYHPEHTYNVDRMIAAARSGLEYFSRNFGPYQFRQFRVLEVPRYFGDAQSFANTVSFSEGLGFIASPAGEGDLDHPFYVTLHELAHQWWAHQVVGAAAQGANVLSEALAEYLDVAGHRGRARSRDRPPVPQERSGQVPAGPVERAPPGNDTRAIDGRLRHVQEGQPRALRAQRLSRRGRRQWRAPEAGRAVRPRQVAPLPDDRRSDCRAARGHAG